MPAPLGVEQQKTPILYDQLEPLHPLYGAPSNPPIPILERVAGRPPSQQRHRLPILGNDLAQIVAHRSPSPQIVALLPLPIERLGFFWRTGNRNFQSAIPCSTGS